MTLTEKMKEHCAEAYRRFNSLSDAERKAFENRWIFDRWDELLQKLAETD